MSTPAWQGGPPDAGKPQVYDQAPPQWTGVPVERDPVSGRLLTGDPLGRGDKGRSTRSPGKTALITAAAVAAVAAVALTVFLVTRDDDPASTAAAVVDTSAVTTTPAAPTTTTEPPVETGPRDIPIVMTFVEVAPPPGFGPDPAYGSVGQVLNRTWTVTGPCDGAGPCEVQHCQEPGNCAAAFTGVPEGGGYVARFSTPVAWGAPECTGGTIDNTITWTFSGDGEALTVTGSWVEQAAQVLFTGSDGRECGLYLAELTIASP